VYIYKKNMMGINKSYCIVAAKGTLYNTVERYYIEGGWFPKMAFFSGVLRGLLKRSGAAAVAGVCVWCVCVCVVTLEL
jgi:hypothetical protein